MKVRSLLRMALPAASCAMPSTSTVYTAEPAKRASSQTTRISVATAGFALILLLGTVTSGAPSRRSDTEPPARSTTALLNRTQNVSSRPSTSSFDSSFISPLQSVS